MNETRQRALCRVHGHVQGVFFRASAQRRARALGLLGWVRNLPDGDVEVLAEGMETRIRELIEWLHQGPAFAQVQSVEVEWRIASEDLAGFQVRD